MAWKAYLDSVTDNPVPTDSFFVRVRMEDTQTARVIIREYKVTAGQTLAEMKVPVLADIQRLKDQDQLKATLTNAIGNEIT